MKKCAAKGVHAQVDLIGRSTANMQCTVFAYCIGFRIFQPSLPCWGALNGGELLRSFTDVCGEFADARLLHGNVAPAKRMLTGRGLPADIRQSTESGSHQGLCERRR